MNNNKNEIKLKNKILNNEEKKNLAGNNEIVKNINFHILSLFPEMFVGPLSFSLPGKAISSKICGIKLINIRDFANDKHKKVDDTIFGGGAGMLMKPDIVHNALISTLKNINQEKINNEGKFDLKNKNLNEENSNEKKVEKFNSSKILIIHMSPAGELLNQNIVESFLKFEEIIILSSRYEGVDGRVIDYWKENYGMREISIGDYILSGGELAAMILIDAIIRLMPGFMNNFESTKIESFNSNLLEFPQYTKPREWMKIKVPEILLSGNHEKINSWRIKMSEKITKKNRKDLWKKYIKMKKEK